MRTTSLTAVAFLLFVTVGATATQRDGLTTQNFTRLELSQKRELLIKIIRHEVAMPPNDIAAIIRLALADPDSSVREGALAAVVSRAAGHKFTSDARVVDNSQENLAAMQSLRTEIKQALADSDEKVRIQAVAAFASLDYSPFSRSVELSTASYDTLIERYNLDTSPSVRAKIVAGFSRQPGHEPARTRKLILAAAKDGDHRVRAAATLGAAHLGSEGLSLLATLLADQHRTVREQAALMLMKAGPAASAHTEDIDRAIQREQDPVVKQRLAAARAAVTRGVK